LPSEAFGGQFQPINGPGDALAMLEEIIEQGEGASPEDPNSHLAKFEALRGNLPPADQVYPLIEDPSLEKYKDHEDLHAVSHALAHMKNNASHIDIFFAGSNPL
jgi:hypothetical protein